MIPLFLLAVFAAKAQEAEDAAAKPDTVLEKGTVSGMVFNENNQPVMGAEIYVYDGSDIIGSATSDSAGKYLTNRMLTGTYDLVTKYKGYNRQTVKGIMVKAWQDTKQDFNLVPMPVKVDTPRADAVKIIAVPVHRRPWWRRK